MDPGTSAPSSEAKEGGEFELDLESERSKCLSGLLPSCTLCWLPVAMVGVPVAEANGAWEISSWPENVKENFKAEVFGAESSRSRWGLPCLQ